MAVVSDPLYNKLSFRGYLVTIRTTGSPFSKTLYFHRFENTFQIKDLMRGQQDPDHFPSPEEAGWVVFQNEQANGKERDIVNVADLEGNILWSNDK